MSTIEVGKILTTTNTADGVKVSHEYYNAGEKGIKYITFSYLPYNSVNDVVACRINGKTEASGKLTGPIPPKHYGNITWENMWYNPTVTTAVLTKIYVQFMDNTEEVIGGKDILTIDDPKSSYYHDIMRKIKLSKMLSQENGIEKVFAELKDDEEALLEVLDSAKVGIKAGYLIGDYIEKEYSFNEVFMKKAVSFWKSSVADQQKYYNTRDARECQGFPEKYAAKIKKYEPAYVIPKKAGCITIGG